MAYCALILFCAYLMLVIATVAGSSPQTPKVGTFYKLQYGKVVKIFSSEICDERKCRRVPLTHYQSLQCTGVYERDNCCPVRYNCNHLYDRIGNRHNTCYINKNEYALGAKLREYDSTLCEEDCTCINKDGFADFECTIPKDWCPPYESSKLGCYQENPIHQCCPTEEICPDDIHGRFSCVGESDKTYVPGEYIRYPNLPNQNLIAVCKGNKTDKGDLITTVKYNRWYDVHAAAGFYKNCAPVYLLDENMVIGIHRKAWRCQKPGDYVVPNHKKAANAGHGPLTAIHCPSWIYCGYTPNNCRIINPEGLQTITYHFGYKYLCRFGQMTMHVGDSLNRIPYDSNSCIVCSCELPPVPTCVVHQNAPCSMYGHCSAKDIIDGKCDPNSFYHKWLIEKGFKL